MASYTFMWILYLFSIVHCTEHFISVEQLNKSLEAVKNSELESQLEIYTRVLTNQLASLERYSKNLIELSYDNTEGTNRDVVKDPVTSSVISKRVKQLLNELHVFEAEMFNQEILKELALKHPSTLDLKGAAHAVKRIQSTYNVTNEMAINGNVFGVTSMPLSVEDSAELGLLFYGIGSHHEAMLWLTTTLQLLKTSAHTHKNYTAKILHKYALAASEYGNLIAAARIVSVLRRQVPCRKHHVLHTSYQRTLNNAYTSFSQDKIQQMKRLSVPLRKHEQSIIYDNLCSNNGLETSSHQKRALVCRHQDHSNMWLKLQPLKEEELNLDPLVVVFHRAFPAYLVERLQKESENRLTRSVVSCAQGMCATSRRISASYFLTSGHLHHHKVRSLMTAFTNTNRESVESILVVNYGIGGFFRIHYDFHSHSSLSSERIASALIYMTDLEDGSGSTVFTNMKLRMQPEKGSVIFWHNLYKNGTKHMMTAHAGCPVVSGSKWIMAVMFQSHGNEFHYPCSLNQFE